MSVCVRERSNTDMRKLCEKGSARAYVLFERLDLFQGRQKDEDKTKSKDIVDMRACRMSSKYQ